MKTLTKRHRISHFSANFGRKDVGTNRADIFSLVNLTQKRRLILLQYRSLEVTILNPIPDFLCWAKKRVPAAKA
jgi:hypothetical protein